MAERFDYVTVLDRDALLILAPLALLPLLGKREAQTTPAPA
jgi:hypothetical protein